MKKLDYYAKKYSTNNSLNNNSLNEGLKINKKWKHTTDLKTKELIIEIFSLMNCDLDFDENNYFKSYIEYFEPHIRKWITDNNVNNFEVTLPEREIIDLYDDKNKIYKITDKKVNFVKDSATVEILSTKLIKGTRNGPGYNSTNGRLLSYNFEYLFIGTDDVYSCLFHKV